MEYKCDVVGFISMDLKAFYDSWIYVPAEWNFYCMEVEINSRKRKHLAGIHVHDAA